MRYEVDSISELPGFISHIVLKPWSRSKDYIDFVAGQYIRLIASSEHALPFSIANAPRHDHGIELYIRHLPNDEVTLSLIKELREKKNIVVEGPFGDCIYRSKPDNPILMIAAGTGFAQIKSLLEQAVISQDKRPIHFYWGMSALSDCFHPLFILKMLTSLARFKYHIVIKNSPQIQQQWLLGSQRGPQWPGRTGRIYEAVVRDHPDLSSYQIYLSGPWDLIDSAVEHFLKFKLNRELIYSDRFEYL